MKEPPKQTFKGIGFHGNDSDHNNGDVVFAASLIGQRRHLPAGRFGIVLVNQVANLLSGDFSAQPIAAEDNDIVSEAGGFRKVHLDIGTYADGTGEDVG
jgi:hypothetical protein